MGSSRIGSHLHRNHWSEETGQVIVDSLQQFEQLFDGLGFCLSEERDLLSQWRGYADDGRGVSLGFSVPQLERLAKASNTKTAPGFDLLQVLYDPEQHEAEVLPTYQQLRQLIDDGALSRTDGRGLLDLRTDEEYEADRRKAAAAKRKYSSTMMQFFPTLYRLKSRAFREEKEWRLVWHLVPEMDHECLFRANGAKVVPYRQVPIDLDDQPTIVSVTLGPKHSTPQRTIEQLLRKSGYGAVEVLRSEATYQ